MIDTCETSGAGHQKGVEGWVKMADGWEFCS